MPRLISPNRSHAGRGADHRPAAAASLRHRFSRVNTLLNCALGRSARVGETAQKLDPLRRRTSARHAAVRPRAAPRAHASGDGHPTAARRTGASRDSAQAARLDLQRVVLARRHSRDRHPVLPGAPAAEQARAQADARGRRRDGRGVHAHPAPRGRARDRHGLPAAPAQALARNLRQFPPALPRCLQTQTQQPQLRRASRGVVRASPPGGGLRGDLRRLAGAAVALAQALPQLVRGSAQTRIRRRIDVRDCRTARRGALASADLPAPTPQDDPASALPQKTRPLRRRMGRILRPRPGPVVLERQAACRAPDGGQLPARDAKRDP